MTRKILLIPAHPAQVYLLKAVADSFPPDWSANWLVRDKDQSLSIADRLGIDYSALSVAGTGLISNAAELLTTSVRIQRYIRRNRPDCVVTKYGSGNFAARLLGVPNLSFNDDDAELVPFIAWSSYPFADAVLAPHVTRMGRWSDKTKRYSGYHELAYLHPNVFRPSPSIRETMEVGANEPFAIIRLSALQAHHDIGEKGLNEKLLYWIVTTVQHHMRVFISSEARLHPMFEPLRFVLPPHQMHHALAEASFYIGDSQTMAAEAAVLGTPSVRISTFSGRLSYLEDLERLGLTVGVHPLDEDRVKIVVGEMLQSAVDPAEVRARRDHMLSERASPVTHFIDVISALMKPVS